MLGYAQVQQARRAFRACGPKPSLLDWLPARSDGKEGNGSATATPSGIAPATPAPAPMPRRQDWETPLTDAEFYSLPSLEQVQYAMNRPEPTAAPPILDSRLSKALADDCPPQVPRPRGDPGFRIAYHPERLEWLGDRVAYSIAAEVLFVLAPLEDHDFQGKPNLKDLGTE